MAGRNQGVTTGDAIYARFSSENQNPRSIDDQVTRLRGSIQGYGGRVDESLVFADAETSGAVWDRPGLRQLLKAVSEGRVSRIFVEDVSRISRDRADLATFEKDLAFRGVGLVAVADGINLDGSSGASLAYGVKSLISDVYLRDLGDKTRRGLQGNAREGKPTGGKTYGYVTVQNDPGASTIAVDDDQARTVVRIFRLYADGVGYAGIAKVLNADGVPPPRGNRRRAGPGWIASCIRELLRNSKYIGEWRFGRRKWLRHPDTRKRVYTEQFDRDVVKVDRPDLAVVDGELWDRVQSRIAANAEAYKSSNASRAPRRRTPYLLSSLLRCGSCGALMDLSGGSPHRYYRCVANRKRGTCENQLSVRETVARERILAAVAQTVQGDAAVQHIRKRLAKRLGTLSGQIDDELRDRTHRLARVEDRIRGIIEMQAEGDRSPYLAEARRDFEAQASTERVAVSALRARAARPIPLPPANEIIDRVQSLQALVDAQGDDVERGREALRRYLKGGAIECHPREGRYLANFELLPLAILLDTPRAPADGEGRCPEVVARRGFEPLTFGL